MFAPLAIAHVETGMKISYPMAPQAAQLGVKGKLIA